MYYVFRNRNPLITLKHKKILFKIIENSKQNEYKLITTNQGTINSRHILINPQQFPGFMLGTLCTCY